MTFLQKLADLLNEFGWDDKTDTADFVLAEEVEVFLNTKVVPTPEPEPGEEVEVPTTPPAPPTGG
jgi:hypothetical protein